MGIFVIKIAEKFNNFIDYQGKILYNTVRGSLDFCYYSLFVKNDENSFPDLKKSLQYTLFIINIFYVKKFIKLFLLNLLTIQEKYCIILLVTNESSKRCSVG